MKDSTVMIGHLVDFVKAANVLIGKDKCTTIRHKFSSKSVFPDFDPDMNDENLSLLNQTFHDHSKVVKD